MKIVCEHCGAKYSIPDDKVAGKTFKIRCKKCSEVLVLRGDESSRVGQDLTTKQSTSPGPEWHVVVDGEQQGPLSAAQLKTLFNNGKANWESYVWREGMSDWLVAQDIAELPELLGIEKPISELKTAPQPQAQAAATASASTAFETPTATMSNSGDMFSGFDLPLTIEVERKPTTSAKGNASAPEPVVAAAPANEASAPAEQPVTFSGQRHESSVLFSLGNLKSMANANQAQSTSSLASTTSEPTSQPSPAKSDASGLFDIRTLMAQSQSAAQPRESSSPRNSLPSDLFRADSGMVIPATLGVPAIPSSMPPEEKKKRWLLFGAAGFGALLFLMLTIFIVRALRKPGEIVVSETGKVTETEASSDQPATAPDSPQTSPQPTTVVAPPENPPPAPPAQAVAPPVAQPPQAQTVRPPAPAPTARKPKNPAAAPATRTKPAPVAAVREPEDTKPAGRDRDLDSLMDEVLNSGSARKPRNTDDATASSASSGDSSLSQSPSRNDVMDALNGVSGAVRSCGGDKSGVANVNVVFAGSSGRVKSATIVGGNFKGTPEGKCIENVVEKARVPRFQQSNFKVTFPYRI